MKVKVELKFCLIAKKKKLYDWDIIEVFYEMDIILLFGWLFKTLEFPVYNFEEGKVYTYFGK